MNNEQHDDEVLHIAPGSQAWFRFMNALRRPPPPNDALVKAFSEYESGEFNVVNDERHRMRMVIDFDSEEPLRWADVFDVLSVMVQQQQDEDDTFELARESEADVHGVGFDLYAKWHTEFQ